jgi:hypothetical protein
VDAALDFCEQLPLVAAADLGGPQEYPEPFLIIRPI